MQLFSQKYEIILKNMHLFFKICSYLKTYATIMHLCKLDSLNDLL